VASSELILVSLWPAMKGSYFRTKDGVLLHFPPDVLKQLKRRRKKWFEDEAEELILGEADRFKLIAQSFDAIAGRNLRRGLIFILGCYTRGNLADEARGRRLAFNEACRSYCEQSPATFFYVDIDAIVPTESLVDKAHFSREGYFTLARHILSVAGELPRPEERSLNAA
jgi:hypothetical protein